MRFVVIRAPHFLGALLRRWIGSGENEKKR